MSHTAWKLTGRPQLKDVELWPDDLGHSSFGDDYALSEYLAWSTMRTDSWKTGISPAHIAIIDLGIAYFEWLLYITDENNYDDDDDDDDD